MIGSNPFSKSKEAIRVVDVGQSKTPLSITQTQDLTLGEFNYTTDFTNNVILKAIYVNFSEPINETITLTYNDTVVYSREITANNSVYISGDFYIYSSFGKQLNMIITNNGLDGIATVTFDIEVLSNGI